MNQCQERLTSTYQKILRKSSKVKSWINHKGNSYSEISWLCHLKWRSWEHIRFLCGPILIGIDKTRAVENERGREFLKQFGFSPFQYHSASIYYL